MDGDDVLGDVVNIAARLETLAPPGGICVSRSIRDLMDGSGAQSLKALGRHFVRNLPAPVEVWQVRTGVDTEAPNLPRAREDRPSLIVLPFENRSLDPNDAIFADGITEDVLSALARFRSLSVIGRGSSFVYRRSALDIRQIALDTGVRYIVRGSVRRSGQRIRVIAQLLEAAPGSFIWSDTFDRELGDMFALQDETTQSIVAGLTPEIGAHERRLTFCKPTKSLSAWELCQKGLTHLDRRGVDNVLRSYDLFQMAAAADPTYALPRALLARLRAVAFFPAAVGTPPTIPPRGCAMRLPPSNRRST